MPVNEEAILVHVVNQPAEDKHTRVRLEAADHAHYFQVVAPVAGTEDPVQVGGDNPNRSRLKVWVNGMAGQVVWLSERRSDLNGTNQLGVALTASSQWHDHLSKGPLYAVTTGSPAITLNCAEETLNPS